MRTLLNTISAKDLEIGFNRDSAWARATGRFNLAPKLRRVFEALREGRVLDVAAARRNAFNPPDIDDQGYARPGYSIQAAWLGSEYDSFVKGATSTLYDVLSRTVLVARWRQSAEGPPCYLANTCRAAATEPGSSSSSTPRACWAQPTSSCWTRMVPVGWSTTMPF